MKRLSVLCAVVALGCNQHHTSALPDATTVAVRPGARTLLDAHNCYPEAGRYADRIDIALQTGMPLAIEQDLYWRTNGGGKPSDIVVAHDSSEIAGAPTLDEYFFARIAPLMDRALDQHRRAEWPLLTLNLDFKTNQPELHDALWSLLGRYERFITTATRSATNEATAFTVRPMLVLTGSDSSQRAHFHDRLPAGATLRVFGAAPVPRALGATADDRARNLVAMSPDLLIPSRATDYVRWVNFPWQVVEASGPTRAGDWSPGDRARLAALTRRARQQDLFIRFYTLDGFTDATNRGYNAIYNFGSDSAVRQRWAAAVAERVDYVATDQYALFASLLRR